MCSNHVNFFNDSVCKQIPPYILTKALTWIPTPDVNSNPFSAKNKGVSLPIWTATSKMYTWALKSKLGSDLRSQKFNDGHQSWLE